MNISEAIPRCIARCEAEAVALGLPPEAGRDIYSGCMADDIDDWTEERFLEWVMLLHQKYEQAFTLDSPLKRLYDACSLIMGEFGDLVE